MSSRSWAKIRASPGRHAVQAEPPRDGLPGQLLDLPADPVVDRLEDAHRQLVPGVAGQHRGDVGRVELRGRLGPLRLLDPRDRQRVVPGEVLGREQQPEVQPADRDRLGIDPQVLVLELQRLRRSSACPRRAASAATLGCPDLNTGTPRKTVTLRLRLEAPA